MYHDRLLLATAYLPPLEYFVHMCFYESAVIEVQETWPKQTWRNRCRIMTANGPLDLTIPVSKPYGNQTKTKDILISNHTDWQKNHWKAIISAYQKAPYFVFYQDMLEPYYMNSFPERITTLNYRLLNEFLRELDIKICLIKSRRFDKRPEYDFDLRHSISPKPRHRKNIPDFSFPPYYQVFSEKTGFVPNLSIIDLIFNLGPEAGDYLRKCCLQLRHQLSLG